MLRITFDNGPHAATLRLEGKVAGPWVDELERTWYDVAGEKPKKPLVVDLSEVSYIDTEGAKMLGYMLEQGAELRDARLLTKLIVDKLKQGTNGSRKGGR